MLVLRRQPFSKSSRRRPWATTRSFAARAQLGPTLAIRPQGDQGDITNTNVAWKTIKGSPFVPSPMVYGNYLTRSTT